MIDTTVDVVIIGGGLTGACLNLGLIAQGISTLLVDNKPIAEESNPQFDARSLALAPASIRILSALDIWPNLVNKTTAIEAIEISQQGHFGRANLHARPEAKLGAVVEMHHITNAVYQQLAPETLLCPAELIALQPQTATVTVRKNTENIKIKAKLIVAADGAQSTVRRLSGLPIAQKKYRQHALVATIGLSRAHNNKAFERFTRSGPLAMLPLPNNRASLVWALEAPQAQSLIQCDDAVFLKKLQEHFGYRLGRLIQVGPRTSYPLQQAIMPQTIAWPLVFIGNAAHTLHPVAGQGFNLGLRDSAALVDCIHDQGFNSAMLTCYQQQRALDQTIISKATDGLVRLFDHSALGLSVLRGLGLLTFDNSTVAQNIVTHYASGFAGVASRLVAGSLFKKEGSDE